jgi:2,3-bisphosphoglycerate-independent phosphoglycerate mutase
VRPGGGRAAAGLGQLALGAGRAPRTYAQRVDQAIADGKLGANEIVHRAMLIAMDRKCRLHLFGLLSDGNVHASLDHLYTLIRAADLQNVQVVVHAFLDGRDAAPRTAWSYLEKLEMLLENKGVIGTLSGRDFAMDREGRWDRVNRAYTAIVRGQAPTKETAYEALQEAYRNGESDAGFTPVRIGEYEGIKGDYMADFAEEKPIWQWIGEEVGFAWNTREDRMHQLSAMLVRRGLPKEIEELLTERTKPVRAFDEFSYLTMVATDPVLEVPAAFPREVLPGTFGEVLAGAGLLQLRLGEAAKPAHPASFFSGYRDALFPGEERLLLPTPREEARPALASAAIGQKAAEAIRGGKHDFVLVHFPAPDEAAHTGDLGAAVAAVEAVDAALGEIVRAAEEAGAALFVVGSHGNCEEMLDGAGKPRPSHTTNPTPLWYVNPSDAGAALREGGTLADVAPTMLEILGLSQPPVMTGRSLRVAR